MVSDFRLNFELFVMPSQTSTHVLRINACSFLMSSFTFYLAMLSFIGGSVFTLLALL